MPTSNFLNFEKVNEFLKLKLDIRAYLPTLVIPVCNGLLKGAFLFAYYGLIEQESPQSCMEVEPSHKNSLTDGLISHNLLLDCLMKKRPK